MKIDPSAPRAYGICDCCGFAFALSALRYQKQWAGPRIINLHYRVCDVCYDIPNHRNFPYALPADPVAVRDPRPGQDAYVLSISGFANVGGVLQLTGLQGYPTSPVGLPPGAVWSNSLVVTVTPGVLPSPTFPAVFFGGEIDAAQLLVIGGGNLPTSNPHINTQLWNNSGVVNVSSG